MRSAAAAAAALGGAGVGAGAAGDSDVGPMSGFHMQVDWKKWREGQGERVAGTSH
jgi:hypothetical protein